MVLLCIVDGVQTIIELSLYISREEQHVWTKRGRRGERCFNTIYELTPILRAWLTANSSSDAKADEKLVDQLSRYFYHEPELLPAILARTASLNKKKKKTFVHSVLDVIQLQKVLTDQALGFKYGGNISDKRWREFFSPMFEDTVEIASFQTWSVPHKC